MPTIVSQLVVVFVHALSLIGGCDLFYADPHSLRLALCARRRASSGVRHRLDLGSTDLGGVFPAARWLELLRTLARPASPSRLVRRVAHPIFFREVEIFDLPRPLSRGSDPIFSFRSRNPPESRAPINSRLGAAGSPVCKVVQKSNSGPLRCWRDPCVAHVPEAGFSEASWTTCCVSPKCHPARAAQLLAFKREH